MLSQETRNAVYELLKLPEVDHIQASEGKFDSITFHIKDDIQIPDGLVKIVQSIFPIAEQFKLNTYKSDYLSGKLVTAFDYDSMFLNLRIVSYEKEKDSAQDGATKENTLSDYTAEEAIGQ